MQCLKTYKIQAAGSASKRRNNPADYSGGRIPEAAKLRIRKMSLQYRQERVIRSLSEKDTKILLSIFFKIFAVVFAPVAVSIKLQVVVYNREMMFFFNYLLKLMEQIFLHLLDASAI